MYYTITGGYAETRKEAQRENDIFGVTCGLIAYTQRQRLEIIRDMMKRGFNWIFVD
jgi:hypothetical protein